MPDDRNAPGAGELFALGRPAATSQLADDSALRRAPTAAPWAALDQLAEALSERRLAWLADVVGFDRPEPAPPRRRGAMRGAEASARRDGDAVGPREANVADVVASSLLGPDAALDALHDLVRLTGEVRVILARLEARQFAATFTEPGLSG